MGRSLPAFMFVLLSLPGLAPAQLSISYSSPGAIYTQNFDGLPSAGSYSFTGKGPFALNAAPFNIASLAGWQFWMPAGTNSNAVFAISTGSSTGNGVYSFGSSASPDRALGSLSASSGIYSIGAILTNNTGIALNTCTLSFTVEQWRKGGSGNRNTWAFRYKTGNISSIDQPNLSDEHALDLASIQVTTSAASLNGNLPDNQQTVSYTIHNLNWKNGEQLLLRWDDADETGSDDACALDNFSFSAQQVTAPPSVSLLPATNISSTTAVLNGTANDNFSRTAVSFEYDTSLIFSHPSSVRPAVDTIEQGSGNMTVSATVSGLQTGITYFFRIKAINAAGSITSTNASFTTLFSLPVLETDAPIIINADSVLLGGTINSTGGTTIIEKGITWSLTDPPSIAANKIIVTGTENHFTTMLPGLPGATTIFVRGFASNIAGTAYGNTQSFTTPTSILSLSPIAAPLTNSSKVNFAGKIAHNLTGLSAANFSINTNTITDAAVSSVTMANNTFTVTVNTGSGDGNLSLTLVNTNGSSAPVYNLPFYSAGGYIIDRTAPGITGISIPDKPAKIGDTISALISVKPDTALYKLISGKIAGISVIQFRKQSDSSYSCKFIITNAGADILADAAVPANIVMSDVTGNTSSYVAPIIQSNDLIDANKPILTAIRLPADKLYKLGDTLEFTLFFNEKIKLSTLATFSGFSITVGTRTKFTSYVQGDGSDSLVTRYIIQPGESDKDGIRVGSPITWLNSEVRDMAGNPAILTVTVPSTKNLLVDGIVPTITSVSVPPPAIYRTGNILDFVINYSERVWIEGAPSLAIIMGNETRYASYISGSGSSALLFRYVVQSSDQDKDGIKLSSPMVTSLASIKDDAGNPASGSLNGIGTLGAVLVNLPSITVVGVTAPPDSIYTKADTLNFLVSFNENAFVKTASGIPSLKLTIGSSVKQAFYVAGSGSATLQFSYAVQPGDLDTNGIQLASVLSYNNGIIQDFQANLAPPALPQALKTTGVRIDAVDPAVKSVTTPAKDIYHEGDTILFRIDLTEPVQLQSSTDTPYVKLFVGAALKTIQYLKGSGTSALSFYYVVQPGDLDKNGLSIDTLINYANSFSDIAGNPLQPLLRSIGALSGVKIDAMAPAFSAQDTTLTLCENTGAMNISPFLKVTDKEDNEPLTWKIYSVTGRGGISKNVVTATSNGRDIEPASVLYQPANDFAGTDTIIAEIADGIHTRSKKFYLQIQARIQNNNIVAVPLACADVEVKPISASAPTGGDGTYKATWESSVTNDSIGFARTVGSSNIQQCAPGRLSTNTWFRRKVESGACTSISPAAKISVLKTGFWTGRYDNEWNNTNNWCGNIVPRAETDVTIDGRADFAAVIKDTAKCANLSLQNNASLTVRGYFYVAGVISMTDGTIDARSGSLIFNGTVMQAIPGGFEGSSVKDLVIDNFAGVSIAAPIAISNSLLLRKGVLTTNDQLKLLSTARVAPSATGTAINGKITLEHVIPGGKRSFRLLGNPFQKDISLDMIKDSIDITGQGGPANGFIDMGTDQPSAFYSAHAKTNDSAGVDAGWVPFADTHNNDWKENTGIRLLVRGRKGQGLGSIPAGDGNNGTYLPQPVLLNLSGPVHTSDVDIRLKGNEHPAYHVIANPYSSPVDVSKVSFSGNIGSHYWVWDPMLGKAGGYCSYPFSNHNCIEKFSAIIVKTTDSAGANILFSENCKAEKSTALPRATPDYGSFLELKLEGDSILYDRFILVFMDTARVYSDRFDAEKFINEDVNLYSLSRDQKMLSIDYRPVTNESIIQLGVQTHTPASLRFRFSNLDLPAGNTLQLHDRYLNKWIKMEKDSMYAFETTADTNSIGNNRFEISSRNKTVADTGINFKLITRVMPQPANGHIIVKFSAPAYAATTIRLLNLSGNVLTQLNLGIQKTGETKIPVGNLLPGLYLVEIRSGEHLSVQKMLKQ